MDAVAKSLAFFESLSPKQRTLYTELCAASTAPPTAPMDVEPNLFGRAPSGETVATESKFYADGAGSATHAEHALLAALLVLRFDGNRRRLQQWVVDAESDAERLGQLGLSGGVWAPPKNTALWGTNGAIIGPLNEAVAARAGAESRTVETAAAVLSSWLAREVLLSEIDYYLRRIGKPKGHRSRLTGPLRDAHGTVSTRHVSAIPAVAALLREHGGRLKDTVAKLRLEPRGERSLTSVELLEEMAARDATHATEVAALKERAGETQRLLTSANKVKANALRSVKTQRGWNRSQAKEVREVERVKAAAACQAQRDATTDLRKALLAERKLTMEEARAEAEAAAVSEGNKLRTGKNRQALKKREWKRRAESAEEKAWKRMEELKLVREENQRLEHRLEETTQTMHGEVERRQARLEHDLLDGDVAAASRRRCGQGRKGLLDRVSLGDLRSARKLEPPLRHRAQHRQHRLAHRSLAQSSSALSSHAHQGPL